MAKIGYHVPSNVYVTYRRHSYGAADSVLRCQISSRGGWFIVQRSPLFGLWFHDHIVAKMGSILIIH